MEEKVVRTEAPKKRTRRVVTPKVAPTRTRAVKRTTSDALTVRKAPPRVAPVVLPVARSVSRGGRRIKIIAIGAFLFAILFGVSMLIGLSDKGQLDVSSKIAERKANATPEEKAELETVPTEQQAPSAPNGGLVGMGAAPTPEPTPVPSPTASSSASTTEPVTEGASESPSSANGDSSEPNGDTAPETQSGAAGAEETPQQ